MGRGSTHDIALVGPPLPEGGEGGDGPEGGGSNMVSTACACEMIQARTQPAQNQKEKKKKRRKKRHPTHGWGESGLVPGKGTAAQRDHIRRAKTSPLVSFVFLPFVFLYLNAVGAVDRDA